MKSSLREHWGNRLVREAVAAGRLSPDAVPGLLGAARPREKAAVAAPLPAPAGPRFKSKVEARYAQVLELRLREGSIAGWSYEPLTLVIGDDGRRRARYTPDFMVVHLDGVVELVEVKGGFCREAAKVRFKVAVRTFGWARWTWATWERGSWTESRHAG